MDLIYRQGTINDLKELKKLGLKSWSQFEKVLDEENWNLLKENISADETYEKLLASSTCFVCVAPSDIIIGMAYFVPSGNATEIYLKEWSQIRYVTVDDDFQNLGIGKKLTALCIDFAKQKNEKTIALHTSEIMANARHIYESIDFKILKEIDPRFGKRYWIYTLEI